MIPALLVASAVVILTALPAAAAGLTLPQGAKQLSERVSPLTSYAMPTAPFDGHSVPAEVLEGRVSRQTWVIDTPGLTTLQVLAPLRAQLQEAGYEIAFQCDAVACGGFDFRFGTEVTPAPDMFVDIRNFRFLSARRGDDEAIGLLVSRSRSAAYVQIIQVSPPDRPRPAIEPVPDKAPEAEPAPPGNGLAATLMERGHVILSDLVFETGADALDPGTYGSLKELAAFLEANPGLSIAVVGHTDSIGSLSRNIALSKRRAESVRTRLIDGYGISPRRIEAEGMGYLAPVASNLTSAGREANRRVEAILLSKR